MYRKYALLGVLLSVAIFGGKPIHAAPPADFQNEVVIGSGLTLPTAIEFLPDGRMLIAELTGRIVIVQPGAASIDATPVLQLINVIDGETAGERGLLNVIADPNFAVNGFIYVFYTAGNPQRDRVSRFTMTGNTASLSSEFVLWQGVADSNFPLHHGGGIAFGADGKLYISTGDNGDPPSAQTLNSDHGKLLRINPDGTVPTDNPFFDGAGPNIDAIWVRGLRNPFRIAMDALTGKIYIGDVGQNKVEEVNVAVRGADFGWPISEGVTTLSGITNPIFNYSHNGRDASVTGGVVYRSSQFPASFQGAYFYGDYAQNWIRYLTFDSAGKVTANANFEPANGTLDNQSVGDPVMLKVGPEGSLYYVDFGWSPEQNPATIRRIRYTAVNQPPMVFVSATPAGPTGAVSFSSAGSFDPEGQPLSFLWSFGDGATSTEANPTHFYQQKGVYSARLALSDGINTTHSEVINVTVGNAPTGTITSPTSGLLFRAGEVINFSGVATDPEDGLLPASAYSWSVLFHHDSHVHPTITALDGVKNGSFTIPTLGHDFDKGTNYEIILTVTDSAGLQHRSSVFINPKLVSLTFSSVPAGLSLSIGGIDQTAPVTRDALLGFHYTISAPNQASGGNQYSFISWSDGGAQSHTIVVPPTAQTFKATYEVALETPKDQVTELFFSEGSGTAAADNSGSGHNGTLVNGPTWTTGKFDNGLSLDGTNDYVSVANPSTLNFGTSDFTIALWLKRQATDADHTILSKADTKWTTAGKEFYIGSNNKLHFSCFGSVEGQVASTGTITNDGLWHHVAVTFNDSSNTVTFYIDGVASGGGTLNLLADVSTQVVKLGGHPHPHTFHGQIDEFRIYSRALSPSEVPGIMNNAVQLTVNNGTGSGYYAPGTIQVPVSANPPPPGRKFALWIDDYQILSRMDLSTTTATIPSIPVTITATYEPIPTPPNQVTALSFSEGSGTAAADNSGSGHNGTLVNGPTWTAGMFGNGLTLDGINDYVSVANPSTLNFGTSDFTIALWLKRQANGTDHTILSKTVNTKWAAPGKEFSIGSDNKLHFSCIGSVEGQVVSTGTITNDGLWHHVAVTFNDSSNTVTFYIDGVASGGGTLNLLADFSGQVVKLGGHPHPHTFNGQIDEFRIFSRALSPSEVQTIRNNAISAP